MTIDEIKALPRDKDGVYEIEGYDKAAEIYAAYTEYETNKNKKAGYPDIMAQFRKLDSRMAGNKDFTENTGYLKTLLDTILVFSPEIYENYRELLDMFRAKVKEVLSANYDAGSGFNEGLSEETVGKFKSLIKTACDKDLLLSEKYVLL